MASADPTAILADVRAHLERAVAISPDQLETMQAAARAATGLVRVAPPSDALKLVKAVEAAIPTPPDPEGARERLLADLRRLVAAASALGDAVPDVPAVDPGRLAAVGEEQLRALPDALVARIAGLLERVDLRALAERLEELQALASDTADDLDARRKSKRLDRAILLRAYLEIYLAVLSYLKSTLPIEISFNGFVVVGVRFDALGITAMVVMVPIVVVDFALSVLGVLIGRWQEATP